MSNWTAGKVSIFQAMGLKFNVNYPKLTPNLTLSRATSSTQTATLTNADGAAAPGSSGPCNSATTTANQKLGQQLAGPYGWGSGSQWSALNSLIMAESGWCNTAQNPTSTAYGIGQFLSSTWATVGGTKTSDAATQINLMLAYIKMRYGTPANAWAHEQSNHWY